MLPGESCDSGKGNTLGRRIVIEFQPTLGHYAFAGICLVLSAAVFLLTKNKILTVALLLCQVAAFVLLFCSNEIEFLDTKLVDEGKITPALLQEYASSGKNIRFQATLAEPLQVRFVEHSGSHSGSRFGGGGRWIGPEFRPDFLELNSNNNKIYLKTSRLSIEFFAKEMPQKPELGRKYFLIPQGTSLYFLGQIERDDVNHRFVLGRKIVEHEHKMVEIFPITK